MASSSRSTLYTKTLKVLRTKSYRPVVADPQRPVLEQMLFAACLEDAHYDAAEQAFAALENNFFDWNEVRVSTVRELSEVMDCLPYPAAAANRVKRILQSVFESTYSFDLEALRKKNLGPAAEQLRQIDGTTRFTVAYVVQSALGGHAIPVDSGVLSIMHILGAITADDFEAGVVPGLERAIAKSKGIEFGSLLHQFGADFVRNPHAPEVRKTMIEISPEAADRLPKRQAKGRKKAAPAPTTEPEPAAKSARQKPGGKTALPDEKKAKKTPPAKTARKAERPAKKDTKTAAKKKTAPQKKPKPAAPKKPKPAAGGKKKSASSKAKTEGAKGRSAKKPKARSDSSRKRSASAGLSKKKPR